MITYHEALSYIRQLPALEKARLLETLRAELSQDLAVAATKPARSLYGSFADLGNAPSAQEIDEARHELWDNFPREDI
ncbi:MAG: hypothetical protein SGJ24_08760 [Chloroflexota bacterium]|nr:hypothetical protein [Chloroflexota bacterium]